MRTEAVHPPLPAYTVDSRWRNRAEHLEGTYEPDKRVMFKIKHERTARSLLVVHPLRPERVVEVPYEHMEGIRFRHTAQFNRARFGDGQGGRQMRRPGAGPGRSGWPRILVA
jgi:nuclear transport factor 2 (NTF2) superfamily protein